MWEAYAMGEQRHLGVRHLVACACPAAPHQEAESPASCDEVAYDVSARRQKAVEWVDLDWCATLAEILARAALACCGASAVGWLRGTGRGRSLMLNVHLDTVGVEGMGPPFEPCIEEGSIGRRS
jgi:hypothetical protein